MLINLPIIMPAYRALSLTKIIINIGMFGKVLITDGKRWHVYGKNYGKTPSVFP
jgi:hypothetical protein